MAIDRNTVDAQRRTYQNRVLLEEFWRLAKQATSRRGRLQLLRRWTQQVLGPDPYLPHDPVAARRHFEHRKARGHFRLRGWCWVCARESPDHRHHIIPLAAGGRNRADNVVPLCATCHHAVHTPWVGARRV